MTKPEDFLLDLLEQEIAARRVSALKSRTKNAKFPQIKDLDTFDFGESTVNKTAQQTIDSMLQKIVSLKCWS